MKHLGTALTAVALAFAPNAFAEGGSPWLPVGLSIVAAPIQIPSESHSAYGVMLNAGYGRMRDVYLVEAGLINHVTDTMAGLQLGPANFAGDMFGLQAGVVNYADGAYGFQIGVVNWSDHLHGLQLGLVNVNLSGTPFFPILNIGF